MFYINNVIQMYQSINIILYYIMKRKYKIYLIKINILSRYYESNKYLLVLQYFF